MNLDVFDGMKGKLTQARIDKGVRDMCRECPVALSISDMVAGHKRASILTRQCLTDKKE